MPMARGTARDPGGTVESMCEAGGGVTTFSGLRRAGLSRRRIDAEVATGGLERVRRGVYIRPGTCADVRAAAAHGGVPACVTAARHLGLWVLAPADGVHVWLGSGGHRYRHTGCACVEHWDAENPDAAVAMVPRILRQILTCCGIEDFFVALESAMHQRLITRAGIAWLRTVGTAAARDAIAFARSDAESGLESLFRWRLRDVGVRMRAQLTIVSVGRVDFLLGDRLIVELDGTENHDGSSHRHRDLVRDAHAAAWGYVTLRFDYAMVVHDWETVRLAILGHLERGLHETRKSV